MHYILVSLHSFKSSLKWLEYLSRLSPLPLVEDETFLVHRKAPLQDDRIQIEVSEQFVQPIQL